MWRSSSLSGSLLPIYLDTGHGMAPIVCPVTFGKNPQSHTHIPDQGLVPLVPFVIVPLVPLVPVPLVPLVTIPLVPLVTIPLVPLVTLYP